MDTSIQKGNRLPLLACPAPYGNSGVMTFVVNHRGIVCRKGLGEAPRSLAERNVAQDPDRSRQPETDAVL
jgi:hypothetical protein